MLRCDYVKGLPLYYALFCIRCGEHLPEDAVFCSACGSRVYRSENSAQHYARQTLPRQMVPYAEAPTATEDGRFFVLRKLLSANGRIGRKDFWIIEVGLFALLIGFLFTVASLTEPDERQSSPSLGRLQTNTAGDDDPHPAVRVAKVVFLIAGYAAMVVIGWTTIIKRLHDRNWSGWLSVLSIIPLVGLVLLLICLFAPGTAGTNRYESPNGGTPFPSLHK